MRAESPVQGKGYA